MDFELTDEQRGLVDSTRALLTRRSSAVRARGLIDTADSFDAELWKDGVDLGWPALGIAESDGGLGQQTIDLALVCAELGYGLAATPFIPVAVAADALTTSTAENKSKLLQLISEGSLIAGWAISEFGQTWGPAGIGTVAQPYDGGYRLTGAKANVQHADAAHLLVVDALLDDAPARFVVPTDTPGMRVSRQQTLDVARSYCDVTFDDVAVDEAALCATGEQAQRAITRSMHLNTVLVCAELVGIGQRLLEMTVAYVKERNQFGRPVGSFQAVKHKCADMRIWVQACTAATYHAAMALDAGGRDADADHAVSVAKAYVSDAVGRVTGEALQLHGGIGFTWEHDLHLYLRRARTGALLCGDAAFHRERLCHLLESAQT
ncbi:acyl-CoA dehydrogenase family protein [Mycolicibacterium litorale]|uniref:acyl-CoA dehydrogenase family protein n=1 Tax=Mycolicibacterium litorale TaxID=758802 RepID=UPI003CE88CB3